VCKTQPGPQNAVRLMLQNSYEHFNICKCFTRYCLKTQHNSTRHRASTSMYSLTFCVHVMLPERHQWKPAVQAAAVMLRTPRRRPFTGQPATPTSHIGCAILRTPPVTRLSPASSARYVAIATQPVHRLQIRPIVHN